MIPEKIKDFLETPEGKEAFKKLCDPKNDQMIRDRKKVFLDPPDNVKRWVKILNGLNFLVSQNK